MDVASKVLTCLSPSWQLSMTATTSSQRRAWSPHHPRIFPLCGTWSSCSIAPDVMHAVCYKLDRHGPVQEEGQTSAYDMHGRLTASAFDTV